MMKETIKGGESGHVENIAEHLMSVVQIAAVFGMLIFVAATGYDFF